LTSKDKRNYAETGSHAENWTQGLENHKRLMQILPFMKDEDAYL
jgi:hypothetical protein